MPQPPLPPRVNPLLDARRERSVAIRLIRLGTFVLMLTIALLLILQQQGADTSQGRPAAIAIEWWVPISVAVILSAIVLSIDLLTPNKKIASISGVFLGILTGIVLTGIVSIVIDLIIATWAEPNVLATLKPIMGTFRVMLGVAICYLCISTVLQTQDQFRLVLPYVEFSKQIRGVSPIILDTSALIDARIVDIAGTGLIQSPFVIPTFVLAELQALADSGDRLKRTRGRRGLEVVTRLQRQGKLDLTVDDTPISARAVDQMLVELARQLNGRVMTTDLALARVAQIQGITALNLHDLANAFKPALIPGEQIMIRLVKRGEQPGQGVGYLDDGTMVVAEGGAAYIGSEMPMLVTSTMQTTAGRLIFTRVVEMVGEPAAELQAGPSPDQVDSMPDPAPADEHAEPPEPAPPVVEPPSGLPAERKPGPFPPNPPTRRPSSPRNPRR